MSGRNGLVCIQYSGNTHAPVFIKILEYHSLITSITRVKHTQCMRSLNEENLVPLSTDKWSRRITENLVPLSTDKWSRRITEGMAQGSVPNAGSPSRQGPFPENLLFGQAKISMKNFQFGPLGGNNQIFFQKSIF